MFVSGSNGALFEQKKLRVMVKVIRVWVFVRLGFVVCGSGMSATSFKGDNDFVCIERQ